MKICFLGDALSIHVQRWCEFFRDKGDEVYLLSFRESHIKGVEVINVGTDLNVKNEGGNSQYLRKIFKVKKIIRDINPDIVNAHYLTSYGFIGALIKEFPLVVSTWGTDILVTPKKNIFYKKLTQYVIKKSDIITSDSNFMSEEIIRLGAKESKVVTAPMGIDPSVFNNSKIKDNNLDEIKFLSMRTLIDNSNVDIIIKAFKKLSLQFPNIRLFIGNDGAKREELENLVKDLELKDKVEFLGCVDREKVVELLKTSDIYISVPTSDSTSVTLLECMASGTFPIVSDLPANREWIEHEVNGMILKDINEEELYKLMKNSIDNKMLIDKAADINSEIIQKRAIWDQNMNFVRNTYLDLIK